MPALGKKCSLLTFKNNVAGALFAALLVGCCFGAMVKQSSSPSASPSSWSWAAVACVVRRTVVGLVDDLDHESYWLFESAAHKVAHGMRSSSHLLANRPCFRWPFCVVVTDGSQLEMNVFPVSFMVSSKHPCFVSNVCCSACGTTTRFHLQPTCRLPCGLLTAWPQLVFYFVLWNAIDIFTSSA